jgi:hypothetical protein
MNGLKMSEQASNDGSEIINWDSITSENEPDPLKQIMERTSVKRNPKGRPKKIIAPVEVPEQQPIVTVPAGPEENYSTQSLVNMFRRSKSQSPPKLRKQTGLRFSVEEDDENKPSENPERITLLKMYKQYFKEPLIGKHNKKERVWTDKHLNSDIYREIRDLENLVSEDDPAGMLSGIWVHSMACVEAFGPMAGLEVEGVSQIAEVVSKKDDFRANMRELLLKYPYLRTMVGLGGYPELKLLLLSATIVKEVHIQNMAMLHARARVSPEQPVPEDLQRAFSQL